MMNKVKILLTVACVALSSLACDETVIDPFSNDGKYFTVYGFLDLLETNHKLRVIPVTRRGATVESLNDPDAELDARVFTTDVNAGVRQEWSHSLEQLEDGNYGHIFRSSFIVRPGARYLLEVVREDGKTTRAETRVPNIPDAELFIKGPEVFSSDSSEVYQDLIIPRIASPWEISAIYLWGGGPINRRIYVPYGRRGARTEDGGWSVRLAISEDQAAVRENIALSIFNDWIEDTTPITLTSIGVQMRVLDENWDPPEGIFDPEVLADPTLLTNVENGYGIFGSIGLYIQEWNAEHLSAILGYTPSVAP